MVPLPMRLYIAEKPSLARAIAEALPQPLKKGEGFIQAANGDVVSWCIGHVLEQAEPEDYDPQLKKWSHAALPIIPHPWRLKPKKNTAQQLAVLKKWIKQAEQLVHAGDPDREGQLLVDEVIDYVGVSAEKRHNTLRLLISDLNLPAVKSALNQLRNNRDFIPLSVSALARSRADWLYGINLTRAYTLQGQQVGYRGVLSVGRVQTPVLGLVVRRDLEIDNFVSKPFYPVWANLSTDQGEHFRAKWIPSEHCAAFLDEEGRNLSRPLADNVARRISHQPATVTHVSRKKKSLAAPLPHNLSNLQIDANRVYGFTAQEVLTLCQSLYEQHKAITYPRSDSRHLPMAHFAQAGAVLASVFSNLQKVSGDEALSARLTNTELFAALDQNQRSKAWNDSKVDAHHAIIPTQKNLSRLSADEAKIYRLVCRNYVAQFLPDHQFFDSEVTLDIAAGKFIARAKEVQQEGWKALFISRNSTPEDSDETVLPALKQGQILHSGQAEVEEKFTSPPKHFTDATLLAAMTGIAAFVSDPELKKILKESDGLGTEATRAGIIELLNQRGFLQRQGKTIKATDTGKALIKALPESTTLPDRTARWESMLTAICEGKTNYETFITPLQNELHELVKQSQQIRPSGLGTGKPSQAKTRSKKSSFAKPKNGKRAPANAAKKRA